MDRVRLCCSSDLHLRSYHNYLQISKGTLYNMLYLKNQTIGKMSKADDNVRSV